MYRNDLTDDNDNGADGNGDTRMDQLDSNLKLFCEKFNDSRNEATPPVSIYRSRAAKEIVEELVSKVNLNRKNYCHRRTSKEKRRHHTISNNKPILPLDSSVVRYHRTHLLNDPQVQ